MGLMGADGKQTGVIDMGMGTEAQGTGTSFLFGVHGE